LPISESFLNFGCDSGKIRYNEHFVPAIWWKNMAQRKSNKSRRTHKAPKPAPVRPQVSRRRVRAIPLWAGIAIIAAGILIAGMIYNHRKTKEHKELETFPETNRSSVVSNDAAVPTNPGEDSPAPKTDLEKSQALQKEEMALAQNVVSEFPHKADVYILMGNVYRNQGNSEKAVQFWQEGLKRDPQRSDAYLGMGRIALKKGNYEEALGYWEKARSLNPRAPGLNKNMALAYLGLGQGDKAIEALEREVKFQPQSSMSYFLLGQEYLQTKLYEKACTHYETAIRLDPQLTNAYYGLFTAHSRLQQPEKAREYLSTFKTLKAQDMKALKDRDDAYNDYQSVKHSVVNTLMTAESLYHSEGMLPAAEALLQRVLEFQPEHIPALMNLADIYQTSQRAHLALQINQTIVRLDPKQVNAWMNIGAAHANQGQSRQAEMAFRNAVQSAPQRPEGYRALAQVLLQGNRNLPEALKLATQAVKLDSSAENFYIASWAYDKNGRTEQAIAMIQEAIRLAPNNSRYQKILQSLQQRKPQP
jgi:tetratricopeptide (TPR) repeat protein